MAAALSAKSADQWCIFIFLISILIPQLFSLNGWKKANFYILLQTFQIMQISKRLCSGLESVVKKSCHQWCSLQSKEKSALEKQHMVDLRCQGIPQKFFNRHLTPVFVFTWYICGFQNCAGNLNFMMASRLTYKQNQSANLVLEHQKAQAF